MIRLLNEYDVEEYGGDADYCYSISESCKRGELLKEVLPSKDLKRFWDDSTQDDDTWGTIHDVLKERYEKSGTVEYLKNLSEYDLNINLVCTCSDKKHCIRSILSEVLLERNIELFLR